MAALQCKGIRRSKPCGNVAGRRSGLCQTCLKRVNRGGFVTKTCKPWEKQRLIKQTRVVARKVFQ